MPKVPKPAPPLPAKPRPRLSPPHGGNHGSWNDSTLRIEPSPGMTPPPGVTPPGMSTPPMPRANASLNSDIGMDNEMGMDQSEFGMQNGMGDTEIAPPVPVDPYPNRIDVGMLSSQKPGSLVLRPSVSSMSLDGKIILNQNIVDQLGIYPNAMVGWEDPLTRATASARLRVGQASDNEILMDMNTKSDSNIQAEQIVIYSLEAPIVHVDVITLEVEGRADFNGFIQVNHRNGLSLGVQENDILAFEDDLTGAIRCSQSIFQRKCSRQTNLN